MDFELTSQQQAIDEGVRKVCADFSDAYWTECEEHARFPQEYYRAMADGGWLGMTMPERLGGAGLGVTEAAIMMHAVTSSGGGYSAASAIHINMFGPHAIVVHGTPEQQDEWLPPLISGEQKACFGVTEPDAGLDTTSIKTFATRTNDGYRVKGRKMWTSTGQVADKILLLTRTTAKKDCKRPTDGMTLFYTDLDRTKVEVRRIHKMGRNAVDSNAVFIDDLYVPDSHRVGEEGEGFKYILDSLNPERILVAAEAIGVGRDALRRATQYAKDRVVFGRPIGQNQGIQFPIARAYAQMRAAELMVADGLARFEAGLACGEQANMAKMLAAEASWAAGEACIQTHGGYGFAEEYDIERKFRETRLYQVAPISTNLILSYVAEHVLGLPRGY